jgi:hypothetical protein
MHYGETVMGAKTTVKRFPSRPHFPRAIKPSLAINKAFSYDNRLLTLRSLKLSGGQPQSIAGAMPCCHAPK